MPRRYIMKTPQSDTQDMLKNPGNGKIRKYGDGKKTRSFKSVVITIFSVCSVLGGAYYVNNQDSSSTHDRLTTAQSNQIIDREYNEFMEEDAQKKANENPEERALKDEIKQIVDAAIAREEADTPQWVRDVARNYISEHPQEPPGLHNGEEEPEEVADNVGVPNGMTPIYGTPASP